MMQRGDLVTVSLQGDHGKPRPALIDQHRPCMFYGCVVVVVLFFRVRARLCRLSSTHWPVRVLGVLFQCAQHIADVHSLSHSKLMMSHWPWWW